MCVYVCACVCVCTGVIQSAIEFFKVTLSFSDLFFTNIQTPNYLEFVYSRNYFNIREYFQDLKMVKNPGLIRVLTANISWQKKKKKRKVIRVKFIEKM